MCFILVIWAEGISFSSSILGSLNVPLYPLSRILLLILNFQQGRDGIVIVKTKQAILIGQYVDPMIAGNAATTVEQLADYLIKTGY
jgi:hypothetical protein